VLIPLLEGCCRRVSGRFGFDYGGRLTLIGAVCIMSRPISRRYGRNTRFRRIGKLGTSRLMPITCIFGQRRTLCLLPFLALCAHPLQSQAMMEVNCSGQNVYLYIVHGTMEV